MDRNLLLVGLGGMIGSLLRYLTSVGFASHSSSSFPLSTLTVNVLGCLLIGVIVSMAERWSFMTPEWRIFLTTGLCGGFTTFSTFSYESIGLMQDGQFLYLSLNILLSVAVGLAATYLGMTLVRAL